MDVVHIEWLFYYQKMFIFCVRAGCKTWLGSYVSPNAHPSFFPISNLCILTRMTWKLQVIYGCSAYRMTALLSMTFLVWFRVARDSTGELRAPDMDWSFSDTKLCAYDASPCIHCYLVCNYAWQQNSHTLWLHTTHQMTALLPTMHRFIGAYLASYTTCCSVFIWSCTLILKLLWGTTVLLDEFADKQ